jgi:flagellar protein FliL
MATKNETESETAGGEAKAGGAASPAKRGWLSRKLIIMVVGGVVGFGVLGGGGYFFMGHHSTEGTAAAAPQPKAPIFVDMPDVLVNLSSSGANERTQYLKVKISLELPDEQVQAQIQPVMPRLLDTFQTYLRELRPTDLDGSAGLYRLKEELTRRVDAAIAPSKINAVLFKEIVVQ